MNIRNEHLLREFRVQGHCEYCGRWHPRREPHHLFTQGAGTLDIRINLIALGADRLICNCHGQRHDGNVSTEAMLSIVAAREGFTVDEIKEEVWRIRRLDKSAEYTPKRPTRAPRAPSSGLLVLMIGSVAYRCHNLFPHLDAAAEAWRICKSDNPDEQYDVSRLLDGTYNCTCANFVFSRANDPALCKHLVSARAAGLV